MSVIEELNCSQTTCTSRLSRCGQASRGDTPDMTSSPFEWSTGLDLLITKTLVLLGFNNIHHRLHHSWIPTKSLLWEAATSDLPPDNKKQERIVICLLANILFSIRSNISLVYRINRRGTNSLHSGTSEIYLYPLTVSTINHQLLPMVGQEFLTYRYYSATDTKSFFAYRWDRRD